MDLIHKHNGNCNWIFRNKKTKKIVFFFRFLHLLPSLSNVSFCRYQSSIENITFFQFTLNTRGSSSTCVANHATFLSKIVTNSKKKKSQTKTKHTKQPVPQSETLSKQVSIGRSKQDSTTVLWAETTMTKNTKNKKIWKIILKNSAF